MYIYNFVILYIYKITKLYIYILLFNKKFILINLFNIIFKKKKNFTQYILQHLYKQYHCINNNNFDKFLFKNLYFLLYIK